MSTKAGVSGRAQSGRVPSSPVASSPVASSPVPTAPAPEPAGAGHPARSVLIELADLLEAERAALVSLDREAIEAFASRKLELDTALQQAVGQATLGASEKALLERVRQSALSNQLLLAHARSCVQGVLSLLSPANAPRYAAPGTQVGAEAPPIALNLRR